MVGARVSRVKPFLLVLAVVLVLGSLAVIAGGVSGGGSLKYSIAYGDWGVPTPFHHHRGPSYVLTSFIWDTLVWKDDKGYVPLLAKSWEVRDSGLTWIFHLREGVKWHDGKPFTAWDVKFTFDYLKEHPFPWGSDEILKYVDSVEVKDNHTVVIHLKEPYADFLDHLVVQLEIIPMHVWINVSDPVKYSEPNAFIGTGPFKLKEYKKGAYYILESNKDYFLGKPIVDTLVLKKVSNKAIALKTGEVDAASFFGQEIDIVKEYKSNPDFKVVEGPSYWVLKLIFNTNKYPLNITEFRKALAYAVNRTEIINNILHGGGEVASLGIVHPESKWYDPNLPRIECSPDKATRILDQLGFKDRDGDGYREAPDGSKFELQLICVKRFERVGELIKEQLGRIGVHVTVKVLDWKVADQLLDKGDFDLAISGHGGILRPWTPVDWPAHVYAGNEQLDKILSRFYSTINETERLRYAWEFQEKIAEDLPVLTIYYPKTFVVFTAKKPVVWFWTYNGIGGGVPMWWNKLALISRAPETTTAVTMTTKTTTSITPSQAAGTTTSMSTITTTTTSSGAPPTPAHGGFAKTVVIVVIVIIVLAAIALAARRK